jgi:hypothetical protein
VREALGDIRDDVVFVGGSTVSFMQTKKHLRSEKLMMSM